jgi:hypothetical protein
MVAIQQFIGEILKCFSNICGQLVLRGPVPVQTYALLASYDMIKLHAVIVSFFYGGKNIVQAVEYKVHYIFSTSLNLLGQAFP